MSSLPPFLMKGDTILIIATARARNKEQIQPSIDILKSWGLKVETGNNIYKKHHQFAGTDTERTNDLQWAVDHKTAKAILIAGGGYGNLRIIDKVNFKGFKKHPKWIAGYSDTTALQSRLEKLKIASIHSTMAFQFPNDKEATLSLKKLLFGERLNYYIPKNKLNRNGTAEGKVVGGNLSMLYALSGSVDDLVTRNKILFIEDLDEQLYHIDRMVLQLKRSGKLKGLKALIVGGMTDMKDNAVPFGKTAEEIIWDAVKEYNYPVCFNFPAGHIKNNTALYFGRKARLSVAAAKSNLEYL
ncbi:S66 peptidase family protein [Aurantibacillus circumpalustris]|uniref:S66 peptidase family protein n=1 Tax=Aurantibacillus circumpalustris TaxID=3036359 RepID=UPI00295B3638|nr:LD-carboxypeptidase [Aurantibacillus circumpalustris]